MPAPSANATTQPAEKRPEANTSRLSRGSAVTSSKATNATEVTAATAKRPSTKSEPQPSRWPFDSAVRTVVRATTRSTAPTMSNRGCGEPGPASRPGNKNKPAAAPAMQNGTTTRKTSRHSYWSTRIPPMVGPSAGARTTPIP